jgi:FMN reductase (NADPH)/FMN reductase [NAD(P)H]
MNETFNVIFQRHSTRKYAPTPITREEKDLILQAAMRAPTAGNMMLYSIIEVEDQQLKDRLAETCDHQPFIASAPYVLLFLADYQRWVDLFEWSGAAQGCDEHGCQPRLPQEGDLMLACCDALIAAQTAVIAAQSLGIGSCYIGDILENAEQHQELFQLPRYTFPITLVCFGYPFSKRAPVRLSSRFDQRFIVHQDHYHKINPADFPELLHASVDPSSAADEVEAAKKYVQALYYRKFVSEFSVEMTRSVRKWLEIWKGKLE